MYHNYDSHQHHYHHHKNSLSTQNDSDKLRIDVSQIPRIDLCGDATGREINRKRDIGD